MRTTKSRRVGSLLAVAAFVLCGATVARADTSTNRPGSILIFPKVVATTTRDTIIQITNTQAMTVRTHCFYVNGSLDRHTGLPQWQETDFTLWLTRQQPTHFKVSTGRAVDPSDNFTAAGSSANAGIDPGLIPAMPTGFTGELVCVDVEDSGDPLGDNALIGNATLRSTTGDVAKYNGTTVKAITPNEDNPLLLDDVHYNACPSSLRVDLLSDGGRDPVVDAIGNSGRCLVSGGPCRTQGYCNVDANYLCSSDPDCNGLNLPGGTCNANPDCTGGMDVCTPGLCANDGTVACSSDSDCTGVGGSCNLVQTSSVRNFLTLVPCSSDFENLVPGTVYVTTNVFDEFESRVSGNPIPVTCWTSLQVQSPLLGGAANGFGLGTTVSAVITTGSANAGVLGVAESVSTDSAGNSASSLINPMVKGSNPGDVIRISE
ncbi:MAG TPA: hypothetical protein VMW17_24040 [Candidatus Binatia bacterium]|nr:hypothetical protein [Candidatus Binatia bacterium]